MCGAGRTAGIIIGSALLPLALLLPLLYALRHQEKKLLREEAATNPPLVEHKTVVVEHSGSIEGRPGVAEIVTTGPAGTAVTAVPTIGGTATVSTTAAGIPGGVAVSAPGQTATVKGEHPVGKPEEVKVTEVVHS